MNRFFLFVIIIGFFQVLRAVDYREPEQTSPDVNNSFPLIYEAEDGDYVDLKLQISSSASNGQFLRMENTGCVTWDVTVSETG